MLLDRLADAELAFADFNARRTSASPSACICRGATRSLLYLTDSSRPSSAYYNRAVAKAAGGLSPEALDELPAGVVALEVRPSEFRADTAQRLLALGFRPDSALCYLHKRPSRMPPAAGPRVTRLGPVQKDLFFDLLQSAGTAFPAQRRAAKADFYCTGQFHAFVAMDAQGKVLGWSTMFLGNECAFLGNAYTPPESRRCGAHTALLVARLNAASDAGVDHVFTDVEHGTQSHRNCEGLGLQTLTINTIWVRAPVPPPAGG